MADYKIKLEPIEGRAEFGDVRFWLTSSFASSWYNDAVEQARLTGRDALRREIVLAVCAVESYLLEWVRDEVFASNHDELQKFVLSVRKDGIRERWKAIIKELANAGRIPVTQRFDKNVVWQDFCKLVGFRDGLIHGVASLPYTAGLSEELQPIPSQEQFQKTGSGWAVRVVNALLEDLHKTIGTTPPNWLVTL